MGSSTSVPNTDDDILAQFWQEFETARDKDAVLHKWSELHPRLAEEFSGLTAMMRRLENARPDLDPDMPQQLGEFKIIRRIGRGGMGVVYEAEQASLKNRRVAVKVIRKGRISPENRARFLREQEVLARLHQTHIVSIHAAGEQDALQYFAMPFIEGAALHRVVDTALKLETAQSGSKTPSLAELVGMVPAGSQTALPPDPMASTPGLSDRPLLDSGTTPSEARPHAAPTVQLTLSLPYFRSVGQVMADAAEALQHAHDVQIVHRDMKPSNLMVDKAGQCWIIDFGLARYLNTPPENPAPETAPQSESIAVSASGINGTPQYMAPEQWTKGKLDARTDVWGLGVTLYELLTLRRAFEPLPRDGRPPTHDDIRQMVLTTEPKPARGLVDNLPPDLAAICRKAMRKEPGKRYPSAREFAEDLRRWLRYEPTKAQPARVFRRLWLWTMRNPGWAAAICSGVFAMLVIAATIIYMGDIRRQKAEDVAKSAEREARKAENEVKRREVLESLQVSNRRAGWSKEKWKLVRQYTEAQGGDELRDQAVVLFAGMDARPMPHRLESAASSVAFAVDGNSLLVGGSSKDESKLLNPATNGTSISTQIGSGPVAYRDDGTPIQLAASQDGSALRLWDVAKKQILIEFRITNRGKPLSSDDIVKIYETTVTPDGAMVAAAATIAREDKENQGATTRVFVWDGTSGTLLHQFDTLLHQPETNDNALAIAPDKSLLAVGDEEGTITLWSLLDGKQFATFNKTGRLGIRSLAFGRDVNRGIAAERDGSNWLLASGDAGGQVLVWDVRAKEVKTRCPGSHYDVTALAFSPDGITLASGGLPETRLWDIATGALLLTLRSNLVTGLAFTPDGKRLAIGNARHANGVIVWQLEEGRGVQTLRGLSGQVSKVCFSPDGRLMAGLAHNWQVGIWDLRTGRVLYILDVPKGLVADNAALAFSPDGRQFAFAASGPTGGAAKLWDLETGRERTLCNLKPGLVDHLAFNSDKLLLFRVETDGGKFGPFGGVDYRLHPRICPVRNLFGKDPQEPLYTIKDFKRHVFCAVASHDGKFFVADGLTGPDRKIGLVLAFDALTGATKWSLPRDRTHDSGALALDPTDHLLFVDSVGDPDDLLVETASGKTVGSLAGPICLGPEASLWIAFDPRTKDSHYGYCLYHKEDKSPRVTLGIDVQARPAAAFNATGSHLAWGQPDASVRVCDLAEIQRRLREVGLDWPESD
jgi:eukaryotic-like serine/threonine-protein kinase